MHAVSPPITLTIRPEIKIISKKCYDDDFENYIEEKQHCYNGEEQCPEFTDHHAFGKGKKKEKSLKPDLEKANFPAVIIAKADEIFSQMKSGLKRGVRKKQLMFFCVREAYNLLGIPEDPSRLAKNCGITQSEMMRAGSVCSPSKINYKVAPVKWQPIDFLPIYIRRIEDMEIMNFPEDAVRDIETICEEVMSKSYDLHEEKPQTVAAAIIAFYIGLHGYSIDKNRYNDIFAKSEMTIGKLKNKVASAYNS